MVDVIGNMPLVRAFCGLRREHRRFDATVDREMTARRRSLLYLERLRLIHALVTVVLTIALLAWAILLWQQRRGTTGDVVLACTLGLSVLHATRDLAVALVDVTQHMARLSEALATLLVPHDLRDHPEAEPLRARAARASTFDNVSFRYPRRPRRCSTISTCASSPASASGWSARRAAASRRCSRCCSASTTCSDGRILIDGQDIARVTQESLRAAIAVVPQDVSLFHRSIMENIRYGRPEASDEEVLRGRDAARCLDFIETHAGGHRRPSSATAASSCRAASASASRSRARSSRMRRCCCSTRRPRRSTANPRRRSARRCAG